MDPEFRNSAAATSADALPPNPLKIATILCICAVSTFWANRAIDYRTNNHSYYNHLQINIVICNKSRNNGKNIPNADKKLPLRAVFAA